MRRALPCTILAFMLSAGCVITVGPPKAYLDLWERGQKQIQDDDHAVARATFQDLLQRFPDQEFNQHVELLLADCEFQLGNKAPARNIRERVAAEASSSELKARALSGLGMMELAEEKFEAAAARFQMAAKIETDPSQRASQLSRAGLALQRGGRFAEARELYRQVVSLAPESDAASRSREQLLYPDHFSVQTGAFLDAANAARQRDLLVKKGHAVEVAVVDTPRGKLHCVRVGRFPDRAQANALRDRLVGERVLPSSAKITVKP